MVRNGVAVLTISIFHDRLAKVQGALDAVEAAKTGVEQHTRMAEKSAVQIFSSIRAAVDSREKAVLKVSTLYIYCTRKVQHAATSLAYHHCL